MSIDFYSSTEPTIGGRRVTSVRQLELLVQFMESHRELALGRVQSKEARALASRLWNDCALICNAEGTFRNPKEWSRYWNDLKTRVKAKLRTISRSMTGTGGGPSMEIPLSPIEDRVAAILGRDVVVPLQGVQHNPFPNQDLHASADGTESQSEEFSLIVDNENVDLMDHHIPEEPQPSNSQSQPQPLLIFHQEPTATPSTSTRVPSHSTIQSNYPILTRSERRPSRASQHSTFMQTQLAESSLDQSRAIFARIEESKLKIEEKRVEADIKRVEALNEIAKAIYKLADALTTISNTLSAPPPRRQRHTNIERAARVLDSSSSEIDDLCG